MQASISLKRPDRLRSEGRVSRGVQPRGCSSLGEGRTVLRLDYTVRSDTKGCHDKGFGALPRG